MSLVISGDASHCTTPLAATISGMANNGSGAVRVQTSAPHLFATGDYVHVVTTGTVISAYFSITVIDATHFDLVGSTYSGTGTGTATDASLTPAIQVPTDGDSASFQLSGMLSALQALADRTQFLRKSQVERTIQSVFVNANGSVVIPPWATQILFLGCGGGGGGGGGAGGVTGDALQFAAGGGGAGAQFGTAIALPLDATRLTVTIGTGGTGGAGGAAGGVANANPGGNGTATFVVYFDGSFPGTSIASFGGGAGGSGASPTAAVATPTTVPVYTPGGPPGPGGRYRTLSTSRSHYTPGPRQIHDLDNNAGVISVPGGAWPARVYIDPVGQMQYCEGGASMATAGNATYSAGVSYPGAQSNCGNAGGTAGTEGAASATYVGGAAGGGGGGGGFGPGGNGGNGGAANNAGNGTVGTAGTAGAANTGGGGGGGGGGGSASGTGGAGAAGGNGGSGAIWILFLGAPTDP